MMMSKVLKFDKELTELFPELFTHVEDKFISKVIYYITDWRYRKSINLKDWLKNIIDNPSLELKEYADNIGDNEDYDRQMWLILKYVHSNLKYVGDTQTWGVSEKWQTPTETVTLGTGDCEDGAILIYALARMKGIPANRLLLSCGDVVGGGHCWLMYKGWEYPLNLIPIDWCYWYDGRTIESRTKMWVDEDNKIYEYETKRDEYYYKDSNYKEVWFLFNENTSYKRYKLK